MATHHHKDGAHHSVPAKHAHPHRGPHGMKKDHATSYNQDRSTSEANEHLTLDGHTFGEDAEYGGPGSAHHLGDNQCHED